MEVIELKSGHKLAVGIAPFSAANKLRKVVAAELLAVRIDIDVAKLSLDVDLSKLDARALNTIKDVVCKLMSSETVEASFFECAARCQLEGKKITRGSGTEPGTFDAEDARGDFLPVAWEVIRANLAPFFAGLDLKSLTSSAPASESQPSG